MERFDATGGASKARTPEMNAQRLCKDAKPTERSYGKGEGAEQWIVQFWEGWTERVGLRDCLFLLV